MVQWLRVYTAITENTGPLLIPQVVAHSCVTPVPAPSSGSQGQQPHMCIATVKMRCSLQVQQT